MDLLNIINKCSEEQIDPIMFAAIKHAEAHSEEGKVLGFAENVVATSKIPAHKGFIHPTTRIKYSNWSANTYSMKTTDYIYGFARYIKSMNINNRGHLVKAVEDYIKEAQIEQVTIESKKEDQRVKELPEKDSEQTVKANVANATSSQLMADYMKIYHLLR